MKRDEGLNNQGTKQQMETPNSDNVFGYLVWERHSMRPTRGIYMLMRGRQIVYIGQSVNIEQRVLNHQREGRIEFDAVLKCYMDGNMDAAERELIHIHQPLYNTIYTDSDPCRARRRIDAKPQRLRSFFPSL